MSRCGQRRAQRGGAGREAVRPRARHERGVSWRPCGLGAEDRNAHEKCAKIATKWLKMPSHETART
eukprot:2975808-Prymnesium_polylepis.1